MTGLTDEQRSAAAWAVAHLIEKHGYSSIADREGGRVDLEELYTALTGAEI
jgi:hypothetical protein